MAALADIYALARIKLDDASFQAEALRSADKAGKTVGDRMSGQIDNRFRSGLKTALQGAAGAALGATFAIAAKGAAELDEATTNLIRDTGLVGAEAAQAKDQLASMYRGNLQGFDQISAALSKVHTDLGLTGEAAGAATEKFLKYQQATGQSSDAVAAYDDILDAWNLTADQAPVIMDKLIASHQKFGGVISESESALSAMAPAMQAANMTIDDGIALLNLFNTAGIDAAKAPTMLAKAVKQLKPGQDINDLIAQIGAIEDPTKRAQRAMEIFGAKTGIGMANAIKPGMRSLDDLTAQLGDTTDATDKAADASLSWGDKWKLALKNVGGLLAQFGQNFGPLLMVAGQFGPKAIAGISGLAGVLGAKLGMTRGASPATPMFVSDVTPGIGGAAGAGGKLGTIVKFAGALGLATVAIELWQNSLVPLNEQNAEQTKAIDAGVKSGIETASRAQLEIQRDALAKGLQDVLNTTQGLGPLQGVLFGGQIEGLKADLKLVQDEIARRASGKDPVQFGGKSPDERDEALGTAIVTGVERPLSKLHDDLVAATAAIKTSNDPTAVGAAIAAAVKAVMGGAGSAGTTRGLIGNLQAQLVAAEAANNRPLADQIKAAIAQLEPFAKGRQWQADQLAKAQKVVDSNKSVADKVADLKAIENDLLSHNRKMAADLVAKQIETINAVKEIPPAIRAIGDFGAPHPGSTNAGSPTGTPQPLKPGPINPGGGVKQPREFAMGGLFRPREPMIVGELRPELLIPDIGGRIEPRVPESFGGGGNTYNVEVQGLVRARDPFEIATQLKRVASFGVVTPRRAPG